MKNTLQILVSILILSQLLSCSPPQSNKNMKKARLETVIYFELSDTVMKLVDADFIPYAEKNGWSKNGNRLELIAPLRKVKITTADGKEYLTDKDGYISNVSFEKRDSKSNDLSVYEKDVIKHGGELLGSPVLITKKGDVNLYMIQNKDGIQEIRFDQEFGSAPDCCKNTIQVAAGDPMDDARCLDYNGYKADGVNRPKSDPLSFVNFVGSDCSIAVVNFNCGLDHYNGGCFQNHEGVICSTLIGHQSTYHTH